MERMKCCPLAFLPQTGEFEHCKETRCAWWDSTSCECCMITLVFNLDEIALEIKRK
jgi:hypothetical protein